MEKPKRYISGDKCLHNGCTKIVLSRSGVCAEHRKVKCKICGKEFIAGIIGSRVCCYCHTETIRIDRGIYKTMGR